MLNMYTCIQFKCHVHVMLQVVEPKVNEALNRDLQRFWVKEVDVPRRVMISNIALFDLNGLHIFFNAGPGCRISENPIKNVQLRYNG